MAITVSTSGRVKPRSFKNLHLRSRHFHDSIIGTLPEKLQRIARTGDISFFSPSLGCAFSSPRASSDYEKIISVPASQ